jgi:AcrR family transcriptional regulator
MPPRKDVLRNRARLLRAARTVMRTSGVGASAEEIAAAAGVGPSTFYRHFPTKDALLKALLSELAEGAVEVAEQAADMADPWEAFAHLFSHGCVLDPDDLALFDAIARADRSLAEQAELEIGRVMQEQVKRAQDAGVLRDDVDTTDIAALMRAADDGAPERRDRRVSVLLRGLRASA